MTGRMQDDNAPKTPRELMEEAARELERQADTARVLRETQGEYVETFSDPEKAGARYYYGYDDQSQRVRVYLGPGEEPPKIGDPNER